MQRALAVRSSTIVRVVLALAGASALGVVPALAQGIVITSPPAGSVVSPGETVTVMWTGGDPLWQVYVSLVDVEAWAVASAVESSTPNDGSVSWVFPSSLPYGGPCGRAYLFYVQEVGYETWAYGPTFTVACGLSVAVDVKPGSFPNAVNPNGGGETPVAVLTTTGFDAASVDPDSVTFGPGAAEPASAALEDVDGDADLDLILHFRTRDTGIACGDTAAAVAGYTYGGQEFSGSDSIRTVGCR